MTTTNIKLEEDKYYKLRSGQHVGPLWEDGGLFFSYVRVDGYLPIWKKDGKANFFTRTKNISSEHDIVEEVLKDEA